jgi:hypothetical protein
VITLPVDPSAPTSAPTAGSTSAVEPAR